MVKFRAPRSAVRGTACWFLGFVLVLSVPARVEAADIRWRNSAGGTFSIGGNWNGGVPGAADNAFFGLSTPGVFGSLPPYTVSFTALASNSSLRIEDDSVVFDLNGLVYETINTSFGMVLGSVSGKTGQLTVLDGIVTVPFQSDLEIAAIAGGSGGLGVGAGGKVIGTMDVLVGLNGAGVLSIFNNGDVIADKVTIGANAGSTGTATITGGGSSLLADQLIVGNSGAGSLSVTAGGRVDSTSGYVGNNAGSTGAVTVDGVGSLWDNASALSVGNGTLSVTAGGRVDSTLGTVGNNAGGTGAVTVDGVGSRWDNTNNLNVGFVGNGTLNITAGGTVHAEQSFIGSLPGITGAVTVNGAGSLLDIISGLLVGDTGTGTLSITNGGHVQSTGSTVGDRSSGLVTVDGEGSQWQLGGSLTLGFFAQGALEITAGGSVQSQGALLGQTSIGTGMVTVDGNGSLWNNTAEAFTVGVFGAGTLHITDGGKVTAEIGATIGQQFGSTGTVTVDGDGSLWNCNVGGITVGLFGAGTLLVTDGGKVTTQNRVRVGQSSGSTGTVIVSSTVAAADSVWEIGGRLAVGFDLSSNVNGGVGTVRIQPGGKVTVGQDTVVAGGDLLSLEGGTFTTSQISFPDGGSANANFQWTSGTLHVGVFQGDLANSAGILAPGSSIGATEIQGNYNQLTNGTLEIEIGPIGQGAQNDSVSVSGMATIDGQLSLSLINGADPLPSQTFIILDANTLTGSFDNIANGQRLTTSDALGSFLVNYGAGSAFDPTQIVLSSFLAVGLPGDYNQNGVVDAADYVVWRDNEGTTNSLPNDPLGGTIGQAHYDQWRAHFGNTAGVGAASRAALIQSPPRLGESTTAVPEPTSWVLLTWVAVGWCFQLRRAASPVPKRLIA
jgi:T5SS/PEP-CTERM-associated repeat protein